MEKLWTKFNNVLIYRILLNNFNLLTGRYKRTLMEKLEKSDRSVFLKMELSIKETGSLTKIRKMEEEYKYGLMDQDMMDSGEMEWLMDTEG